MRTLQLLTLSLVGLFIVGGSTARGLEVLLADSVENPLPNLVQQDIRDPAPQLANPSVPLHDASVVVEFMDELTAEALMCPCESCQGSQAELTCAAVRKAAVSSHQGLFYDNKFSYLDNSACCPTYLGDSFKRLAVGDCWTVDVGGQYRLRYHNEHNIRNGGIPNGLGLTGRDDEFLLHRTRLYANVEYGSHFRFYGEMLDAVSNYETYTPRTIEENRADLQNLFIELRGLDVGGGTMGGRVGRQEISLGNQRVVSPLDWANTRRTFEGARLMWQGDDWDIDALWLRPLHRDHAHRTSLDPPNLDRQLYGIYGNYKGLSRDNLETYWLALDYEDVGANGIRYDTIGTRYWGSEGDWLYELEAAVQFGKNADNTDHSAGAITAGLGHKFSDAPGAPTVWAFYDWASGDNTVGNGYHHYEPLGHKYLGFMDLFGRRNIQDFNLQATAKLSDKLDLLIWYHYFRLANGNDVAYNVDMTSFAGLGSGTAGSKDLGHEIDLLVTHVLTPRMTMLYGYSHFFAGAYYDTSGPTNSDADFVYIQWHLNF